MAYTKVNWKDLPNQTTPVNATNLGKMDDGIADLDANKQDALISGINIKTINNESILGNGDIQITTSDDVYSTSETITNKIWIDGKPIYRKVCVLNVAGHSSTWTTFSFATLGLNNIDYIYMADGTRSLDSGIQIRDINYNRNVYIATNTSTLEVGPYSNATVLTIVFEYTKTTDTRNRNITPILDGESSK